ncbi:serine protease [Pelomonas sp. SE-A7]|uniref:S1C family serine protease n=1 Tax=Pelomonas sp. SE-A7 TaxID=3054953 RepID=UPI00259C8E12|nr:serine protease [Pelomonas sp. SE-A7]MDM4764863.1 serine protease [Pelomonas sp. SE-A7]
MRRRDLLALSLAVPVLASAQSSREALIERASSAVLPVGTFAATDSPRFQFRGTGFAIGDGRQVVTNVHVLPPSLEAGRRMAVLVREPAGEGRIRVLELQTMDRARDLAVLRLLDGPSLENRLSLASAREPRAGQEVLLMGYPLAGALGYSLVTHRGMISARTRMAIPAASGRGLSSSAVAALRGEAIDLLQLDAVAYPGNSGGPLLDAQSGEVIGIVNMVLVKAGHESALSQPSGISYAIPVAALQALLNTAPDAKGNP